MKPTLYIIGDSTGANKLPEKRPESGWGEHLNQYFTDDILIDNRALNGRSSKSFIEEGHFERVSVVLREGDYLMIQFGHNDQKMEDAARYTDPYGSFQKNIKTFITTARDKKATPILLTPVVRRLFKDGLLDDSSAGDYYPAAIAIGIDQEVATLDMFAKTATLVKALGEERSTALYLHLKPGEHPNYPQGVVDNTHFSELGAHTVAEIVVKELKKQVPSLMPYLTSGEMIK